MKYLILVSCLVQILDAVKDKDVVYAVNCGGDAHRDSVNGVNYDKDPNRVGVASDYGKQLVIGRVNGHDQALYQTERYHTATFGYDVPINEDGDYLLVLKFSEVYFNAPNMKVFDVVLNGDLTIAADLDIHEKVGRGVAHDELVEFKVKDGKILLGGDESEINMGKVRVEFIKSYRDNPKINAIALIKGSSKDWTPLPEFSDPTLESADDELDDEEFEGLEEKELRDKAEKMRRNPSGPKTKDPYESDDTSALLPVFVAVGAFIPLVFCLCKL